MLDRNTQLQQWCRVQQHQRRIQLHVQSWIHRRRTQLYRLRLHDLFYCWFVCWLEPSSLLEALISGQKILLQRMWKRTRRHKLHTGSKCWRNNQPDPMITLEFISSGCLASNKFRNVVGCKAMYCLKSNEQDFIIRCSSLLVASTAHIEQAWYD